MFPQVLLNLIDSKNKFLILLHENPDGDTIATSLGLALAFKKLGKYALCVCQDSIPELFEFLPGRDSIQSDFLLGDFEVVVVIDSGDLKRTGFSERLRSVSKRLPILNIDHHPKNDLHKIATYNLVDYEASSAGEVVLQLLEELKIELDIDLATCFLTSLYTDTGGFRHPNTSSKVLETAAFLLKKGGKLKLINRQISSTKPVRILRLWGRALSSLRTHPLGIISSFITLKDLKKLKASPDDLAGVVNLINTAPEARIAILFSELPSGKIKASLRTEEEGIDLAKLTAIFGGGGHKKAAGFTLNGRIEKDGASWKVVLEDSEELQKDFEQDFKALFPQKVTS